MTCRPATFKTEPLEKGSNWINVVVTWDGKKEAFFINGSEIPVIIDENVPEGKFYIFNGNPSRDEIERYKQKVAHKSLSIKTPNRHNPDTIRESSFGAVWDIYAKINALAVKVMGNHDGGIFNDDDTPDGAMLMRGVFDTDGDTDSKTDFNKVKKNIKDYQWRKEKWHVNYTQGSEYPFKEQIANRATSVNTLEAFKDNIINSNDYKSLRELTQNSFIKTSLLDKGIKKDDGSVSVTAEYKLIPDEPEGQSLNMWLRNIVTDDKQ